MIINTFLKLAFVSSLLIAVAPMAASKEVNILPSPNGIEIPKYYKNWQLIGSSHRIDKNSLRVILGNSIAVKAANEGKTNPWPEGTILAKLAWKDSIHPQFPAATVPGELQHVEFMIKDSKKFPSTQGWGFARWLGMEQKPFGESADFAQECFACHTLAKDSGYVFTRVAPLP
jgi:hypothetical protein